MIEWIATFGHGHTHPTTGEALHDRFVAIAAETEPQARSVMVGRFGRKWAFLYRSRDLAGVDEFELTELALSRPKRGPLRIT